MGNVNVMGRRVLAFILDSIVLAAIFIGFAIASGGFHNSRTSHGVALSGGAAIANYLVWFGYFVLLEWLLGATLGKLIFGLRVRRLDGSRISFLQSLARNLLRFADAFPYIIPYLAGFVIALASPQRQRLGDMAAKTVVSAGS